jgi:hypothetical protein
LETSLTAPNPYSVAPATESTSAAKARLNLAHRFETARGKAEDAQKRSVGVVGFYGRVPATIEAFAEIASKLATSATYTFAELVKLAEVSFVSHNPDRKKSANSAALYAQEVTETLRLLGLVTYNPQAETYAITAQLRQLLQNRTK